MKGQNHEKREDTKNMLHKKWRENDQEEDPQPDV